ncbi:MAG TPA: bifunctional YncE family protein/alkaline phosphatase family protein [Puia sp.]|uniref:bifunctional YncE family protein/alkaline phosphatase family protein n=1 Tax=Puia sp. TaxID=2045100 RepID=UPI002CD87E9E|nr:bifunctional YncE family protein/alkaline phosphatase family protein [Puia sp.]HVU99384.1 bifunctional YncE family protein/alkaline phosphatase family protein [Puia sp.]
MKLLLPALLLSLSLVAQQSPSPQPGPRVQLPNGWSLTPAGTSIPLSSDLPLNIALSPDGTHAAVTNNGNGAQTIDLINLSTRHVTSTPIGKAWLGLAFSKRHPYLYASGGNDDWIIRYTVKGDSLINKDTLVLGRPWPKDKISPTGLALDDNHDKLYVVTKEDNSLYIFNIESKQLEHKIPLSAEAYTCLLNPAKPELYISAWGGRKIWIYNTRENKIQDSVTTEDHPTDMALDPKARTLYVANANSNSVSVIDVAGRKVIETLNAGLMASAIIGSTTNSVCLDAAGKTLYIANADNNCLAVFDVSHPGHSRSNGFIPVGWYPTCVRRINNTLLVANGKGMSSLSNVNGPNPTAHDANYKKATATSYQYIGSLFKGTLSFIPTPDEAALSAYTLDTYANTPFVQAAAKASDAAGNPGNPIPRNSSDASPIKYVFYVLKENRTYDQVLGDLPQGNGDTSLVLFGRNVTPNAHALAEEFVLLDNFYVDAEVSADGHNWSMAGYATDFVEKNWPTNYSGRGGEYDFDGHRPVANPTKGFIWDYCRRAGVSFRNYGEFEDNGFPTLQVLKEKEHYCKSYPGWNLDIQDIRREKIFEADFDSLLQANALPRFSTIYLPNDHTSGLHKGAYTPIAQVADNDLALGRLVDHISHSPIWKESAIFVLEDDAQDGPDHVDAHRSPAYLISPFIKRHAVNHTLYSTTSILHTMELILGLPPMSQFDAGSTPMWSAFSPTADATAFNALPAGVDINARNTASSPHRFNLADPDRIPDDLFNAVLWKAIKGEGSPIPKPRRAAFVNTK